MKSYIDFHVHIDYYQNYKEIYGYYNSNNIYTLFVTNFPEVYQKAKKMFVESKYVNLALGYHPAMIEIIPSNRQKFDMYCVGTKFFGEVGLDFSNKYFKHRDEQIGIFSYICRKAKEGNKILSVHSRKAEYEVIRLLYIQQVEFAVFHWYTGSLELLREIVDLGYYFSLNPSMLKTKKGNEVITNVPLDKILIETDGPYSTFKNRMITPIDIPNIYGEFEKVLKVTNLKQIVFQNSNELLDKQLKSK